MDLKKFIKMVRKEIREWRFHSWHFKTQNYLRNIKEVFDDIVEDFLGGCSIMSEDFEDYKRSMLDFTQRI